MKCMTAIVALLFVGTPAFALDWSQPILDGDGRTISDCPPAPDGTPEPNCKKVLTLGSLTARALLQGDQSKQATAEQKALEGHLGLEILSHPDFVPTPKQLDLAKEAIGRLPSPLAVARAWDLLDAAVK